MAGGTTRKISATSARIHTRKPKSKSPSKFPGMLKKVLLVSCIGLLAWAYQAIQPPPSKKCGSIDGPRVTSARVQLKDGRYLAYTEHGVSKDIAKHKIVYVHGFDSCRHDVSAITAYLSPGIVESLGVYFVSFDRPGYGESDPNPKGTRKSIALDIEELADKLELGSKFYVAGFSMGGQIVWTCLKYIPHRLAGAVLVAPVVNYWWSGLPLNLSKEAYGKQLLQDQWALRVAHYTPWLTYWWSTQKMFPPLSVIAHSQEVLSSQDLELMPRMVPLRKDYQVQVRQQGEFESIHRDAMNGFGKWEFDPTDLKNLSLGSGVSVHLWQGDEDILVPVTLQRYIANQLPWIQYHELSGAGHMFTYAPGRADSIIQTLLSGNKDSS